MLAFLPLVSAAAAETWYRRGANDAMSGSLRAAARHFSESRRLLEMQQQACVSAYIRKTVKLTYLHLIFLHDAPVWALHCSPS